MALGKESRKVILNRLASGQPPPPMIAGDFLVGFENVVRRWKSDLEGYVASGGSLIRIVSAQSGGGKTHLANALQAIAARMGFLVCLVDAQEMHTDDDLFLYYAVCSSLKAPRALLDDEEDSGLHPLLLDVSRRMTGTEIRSLLRSEHLPITALGDAVAALVDEFRKWDSWEGRENRHEMAAATALEAILSGQSVNGTRSLAKVRRMLDSPLLRKISRAPGKRDARLWLESMLRLLRILGFRGVLLVLDEHDRTAQNVLDRHIVQLRRMLDRLTEGHLPGVFAVYFVLDSFKDRVEDRHMALAQRIVPLLGSHVPNRVMTGLDEIRGMEGEDFLRHLGERIFELTGGTSMPPGVKEARDKAVRDCSLLGMTDTRRFVKQFVGEVLNHVG